MIIRRLGFRRYSTILPQNRVGAIWLLWNAVNVDFNVIAKEPQIMHCTIYDKSNSKKCMILAIYAPAQECEKDEFWDPFKYFYNVVKMPWCLWGYFNEMLLFSKKIGGNQLTNHIVCQLSKFLRFCSCNANVQGQIFTWKKFLRGNLVYEKLDRIILGNDCL